MSYLRAFLMATYGKNLDKVKTTEPSDVAFELYVLQCYQVFIERVAVIKRLSKHSTVTSSTTDRSILI
jgi:hypothetical protein